MNQRMMQDFCGSLSDLLSDSARLAETKAELSKVIAERDALIADAERIDWCEMKIKEKGSVWFLPCGENLRFVQVRNAGDCHNYPTVIGLRNAITAAMKETKP